MTGSRIQINEPFCSCMVKKLRGPCSCKSFNSMGFADMPWTIAVYCISGNAEVETMDHNERGNV